MPYLLHRQKRLFRNPRIRDPVLARNIIRKLSKELRGAEELATSIAQRSARENGRVDSQPQRAPRRVECFRNHHPTTA